MKLCEMTAKTGILVRALEAPPPPPPQRLGVARGGGASVTATRRCAGRGGAGRWVTRGPQTSWWLRRAGRGYAGCQEGGADRGGHAEASHRGGDVEEAVTRRRVVNVGVAWG